jgi:hypothetical protein
VLFETIGIPLDTPELPEAPLDALASLVVPPPPITDELPALPGDRTGLAMLSYTRLAHDIELPVAAQPTVAIDPAEFDVDDASGTDDIAPLVGPDELPPGADSGLLLHDVLEVADVVVARGFEDPAEWASQPTVATLFADAARTRGIDRRFLPHAARLAHRMLTGSLVLTDGNMLPSLAAAPSLAREIEFAYPLDDLDQENRSHHFWDRAGHSDVDRAGRSDIDRVGGGDIDRAGRGDIDRVGGGDIDRRENRSHHFSNLAGNRSHHFSDLPGNRSHHFSELSGNRSHHFSDLPGNRSHHVLGARGFVRGFIDALVAWDDEELWIVDYKSDVLAGTDLVAAARARVEEHYAVQARLYSIAVDRMRGRRRLAGMLYAFMRHDIVVPWRVDEDHLATWRTWLADVAAKIAQSKEAS